MILLHQSYTSCIYPRQDDQFLWSHSFPGCAFEKMSFVIYVYSKPEKDVLRLEVTKKHYRNGTPDRSKSRETRIFFYFYSASP